MNLIAFLGTGACDPNKDLKQVLAVAGTLIGWIILIFVIRKINESDKDKSIKLAWSVMLVTAGLIGSAIVSFAVWIGLACSG